MAAIVVKNEDAVSVRFIKKDDVDRAVEVERLVHQRMDPDFQVEVLPRYAWSREDFRDAIRQYQSKSRVTNETRVLVAERLAERKGGNGLTTRETQLVGTMVYERGEDGYEVVLMSALDDAARLSLLKYVVGKMGRSESRKKLTVVVPDGDWALLKFIMKNELTGDTKNGGRVKVRLFRDPTPDGFDLWLADYRLPAD